VQEEKGDNKKRNDARPSRKGKHKANRITVQLAGGGDSALIHIKKQSGRKKRANGRFK